MSVNYQPRRAKQQVNPYRALIGLLIVLAVAVLIMITVATLPAGAEDTAGWVKSWESTWVKSWESPWEKSW